MTRRDYVLIAKVLKRLGEESAHCFDSASDRQSIAHAFAEALRDENPRFDTVRFVKAATLEGDEERAAEERE